MANNLDLHSFLEKKALYSIANRIPSSAKSAFPLFASGIDSIKSNQRADTEDNIKLEVSNLLKSYPAYNVNLNLNAVDIQISKSDKVYAIFEVKKIGSREMITINNLNEKAFYELIVNFAFLDKDGKADNIKWLIATNGVNWFAFFADSFRRAFLNNNNFMNSVGLNRNLFSLDNTRKNRIYKAIKNFINQNPQILNGVEYIYFSISNNHFIEDASIFLSPEVICMEYTPNVDNQLNPDFYKELLYIMGLKENNDHKIEDANIPGSFYEQIMNRLQTKNLNDEERKEKALELIIIWFNRILFLKLFESRLISFNGNNHDYSFMNIDKIPDFATLKRLFFDVLSLPINQRPQSASIFSNIPYLNSSLFEEKEVEREVSISDLANDRIWYYGATVLKDNRNKKKTGETRLLNYLFEFLGAYNFGSSVEGLSDLISPAVLGLIFEKINGYKDGSYYTPNEITDYMAETAIKDYLIRAVNTRHDKNYQDFESLLNAALEKDEIKNAIATILDEIKICDPAVGSGHFLVSALNVLLELRFRLGLLKGNINASLLKQEGFKLSRINGDIILMKNEKPFMYNRPTVHQINSVNSVDQMFQETIFETKKFIIENNLFGVDINPKSVEIARLRLWIELLKNAYYKQNTNYREMETLPNIDINIKVGDSLVSPVIGNNLFGPNDVVRYKQLVAQYQNAAGSQKQSIKAQIDSLKNQIMQNLAFDFIWAVDFPQILDNNGNFVGFDLIIANPPYGNILTKQQKDALGNHNGYIYSTKNDIASPFIERGIDLLKEGGILIYIITNAVTYSKDFSKNRKQMHDQFENVYIYSFDRDRCTIFSNMSQSVSIVKCVNKQKVNNNDRVTSNNGASVIQTSKMYRTMPNLNHVTCSPAENFLLPFGITFNQEHRLPKIGSKTSYELLDKLFKIYNNNLPKLGSFLNPLSGEVNEAYIRTSGNYWYNAWDWKPYNSSKIKQIKVRKDIYNFFILLVNSSLFYFWLRVYGDGRDLNFDILKEFPVPQIGEIKKHEELLEKARQRLMSVLKVNYTESRERFETSRAKGEIDLVDLLLAKYIYNLEPKYLAHLIEYDREVRGGFKLKVVDEDLARLLCLQVKNNSNGWKNSDEIDRIIKNMYP